MAEDNPNVFDSVSEDEDEVPAQYEPGTRERKGSHPILPVHHTTMVLHRSCSAAMHMPTI